MELRLNANATTTPKMRAYIQASAASIAELAAELGVSHTTIRHWKTRATTADGSHTPHRLAISLTPVEEELVRELRTKLELALDDACPRAGGDRRKPAPGLNGGHAPWSLHSGLTRVSTPKSPATPSIAACAGLASTANLPLKSLDMALSRTRASALSMWI
jgi:transposase-like protein